VQQAGAAEWSVLIMDPTTTKVMSNACRISEILDYGVSLVDDIQKRREPLPALSGIYFLTPTDQFVQRMLEDWDSRPYYNTAHIFFSSKVSQAQLQAIKQKPLLLQRLKTLKEVNIELLTIDKRTFVTDEEKSLQLLFGEHSDGSAEYRVEIASIASRLATAFACLKEFPTIRFRAAKPGEDHAVGLEARSLVAQRIAVELDERLAAMQRGGQLPANETCELVIFDRGFDPVAPIIHEWTYEAMVYDLLNLKGEVFSYEIETQGGKMEKKEHLLSESDTMWVQLRHKHFAEATQVIANTLDDFRQKNRAAAYKQGGNSDGDALDMRSMRNLVSSLPQYREQLSQLSVHVEMASKMNKIIEEKGLTDLGKLEQDLVFGDATSKEVITYLSAKPHIDAEDKVRLLMSYVATHPEKMILLRKRSGRS
jgi:syntaxin-binding protein 1